MFYKGGNRDADAHYPYVTDAAIFRLSELNQAYEEKYPKLRYITFVNGRTRAEIIPEIEHLLSLADGTQEFGSEAWTKEMQRDLKAIWLIAKARTQAGNF